ncbi:MAG: aryl-sulfate sulfotransferase [Gemmataceae bacterium]
MQAKRLTPVLLALLTVFSLTARAPSQTVEDKDVKKEAKKEVKKEIKPSVSLNDARAFKGYTLIAPLTSKKTHLIDMEGRIVHTWDSDCTPALVPYLLDNGNLLRPGTTKESIRSPGMGGRVQEFTWDGKLVWDFTFTGKNQHPHHDITLLPNGNILMIISDRKTAPEAAVAGRRLDLVREVLNADAIIEVKKTGPTSGEIVWEWHSWDHLVQDHDKKKANFDKISLRPERIDVNYASGVFGAGGKKLSKDTLEKLRGLGYIGGADSKPDPKTPEKNLPINLFSDWTHFNCVAYNAELDQIMISVHAFSEIWVIDHSTTSAEAAGSKGGKYGKGGDLLYRWGNPNAYRAGTNADRRLFHQHNAHWIPKGMPGAGSVLIFNNGFRRGDGAYSTVEEISLPMNKSGSYDRTPGAPYGPDTSAWSYAAPKKSDFYSAFISGAERLPNGNTLICSGMDGTVFEVTRDKEMVWKFVSPTKSAFDLVAGLFGGFQSKGLFRSYRYGVDHPAFKGRSLTPGKKIEES